MYDTVPCNSTTAAAGRCNADVGSINLATGVVEYTDYGYIVSDVASYIFVAVFAAAFVFHLVFGSIRRQWSIVFTLGCGSALEAAGWGGRIWSVVTRAWDENLGGMWEYDHNSFILQIVALVIAPTFFSAANYILLGKLIHATDGDGLFCSLTPRSFSIIFITADFFCLVIQGAGGGIAGTANTSQGSDNGAKIITAGVILQLVVTLLYVVLLGEFAWRYQRSRTVIRQRHPLPDWKCLGRRDRPSRDIPLHDVASGASTPRKYPDTIKRRSVWITIGAMILTTSLIVIRSFYRSVELLDGWTGPIAVQQDLFLGLDASLMAVLVYVYIVLAPGFFLPRR